ncbi:MAG: energy-coupling factor ABC transporter permease [Planctomycetaceae bacterium]|nr:energy-coupling factor ABC transporter permease [Planctomycetaceae bacterium]
MHMADALISPAVGGTFWLISTGLVGYSCRKVKAALSDSKVPLMGVVGAFVFAAQMINFTVPGTGSSGHLGGGLILAILLGPWAGFLVMTSVLTVQALFFADGGLLALGCNIFNLGFWTCFVAYPLVYKKIASLPLKSSFFWAAMLSSVAGLQLGAFSVVLQTVLSGVSELPFVTFVAAMQPIHLAIGIVEGFVTAGVVAFVVRAQPQLLETPGLMAAAKPASTKLVVMTLMIAAVVVGGAVSWFASAYPDGLEWSMSKTSGTEELDAPDHPVYSHLTDLQAQTAFLPDYGFKERPSPQADKNSQRWPAVNAGTTVSGLVGGLLTLTLAFGIGFLLKLAKKHSTASAA